MTNEEKLLEANRLILEVQETFNNQQEQCPCCGAERFVAWNERQMREQLNGAMTRIGRVIERMNRVVAGGLEPPTPILSG